MAEETIIDREEETLNSDETAEISESAEDEKEAKVYTEEEVEAIKKKMQSDSEKGVQKVLSEKKLFETAFKESKKVANDPAYLIDMYESNPQVAKAILENYYDGMDLDQYKESIGYEVDLTDPKIAQKQIEAKAKKLAEKTIIQKAKEDFIDKLQMSKDEKDAFEEAFSERMELRSFKIEDVQKHFEKAYREVSNDSEVAKTLKTQETIGKTMATGDGKGGGETSKKSGLQNEIADFLKTYA